MIAELESEKATFEVNAEQAGVLKLLGINEGDTIKIGDVLANIDETAAKPATAAPAAEKHAASNGVAPVKETAPIVAAAADSGVKATPVASAIHEKRFHLKRRRTHWWWFLWDLLS